jgi:hypothetical protein
VNADPSPNETVDVDDPDDWGVERLQEECADMARRLREAEHYRDKYDRRRGAYMSAIAPLVRNAAVEDGHVVIPMVVWDGFTSDIAQISYGRIPEVRS